MLIELHMLQNFAPSNLNRDDTGAPKDCEFGGHRRARISSQCQKRAIREHFEREHLFDPDSLGERTKRLRDTVGERLVAAGVGAEDADRIATNVVRGLGLKFESKNPRLTEYLVFIGRQDLDRLVELCVENQAELLAARVEEDEPPGDGAPSRQRGKRGSGGAKNADSALKQEIRRVWKGRSAVDIALFGRMLADLPDDTLKAACQVAHALSTNAVSMEFDFFTAVDDLKPPSEDPGAGMLGTIEFNSSCYYRYANIDLRQLLKNLGEDRELAGATVRGFIQSAVTAVPTGKQNTFAAHNPPSLVMAVLRVGGPWSLANAFVKPVTPRGERDLIAESISALDGYWGRLTTMYGDGGVAAQPLCLDASYASALQHLASHTVPSVTALIDRVDEAIDANGAWG